MKKKCTFLNLCKKVSLLVVFGMFTLGHAIASEASLDELFEHYSTLNKKSSLVLAVGQENPLDLKLTISVNNVSLADFVTALQKSAGDKAFFNITLDDTLKKIGNISINAKDTPLKQILDNILSSKGLAYSVKGNVFIIHKGAEKQPSKISVKGVVVHSQTKDVLPAVTISVLGTTNGAISDAKGQFNFNTVEGAEIEVSFVGMKTIIKQLTKSEENLVIEMSDDVMAVEEVVITGIFNKAKDSYTGSVATVTAKEIGMFKGQNLLSTLKNIDPSLNVVTNNINGSNPNNLPEVNIRGNSSLPKTVKELNEGAKAQLNAPLVIMDGFEISLQKLMDYNDEEIASINILKDASATSIYGSRGANGVIVVVTKVPEAGKLRISFKAGTTLEIPDLSSYNLMNAKEKLDVENRNGLYSSSSPTENIALQREYNRILNDVLTGVDTDWISQPVRIGVGHQYNLGLTGGNEEFRWMTNLSYKHIAGAMKDSNRDNFSGSVSLSYNLKNVIFKNQTSITSNKGTESKYGVFYEYAKMNPYWKIYNSKGDMIKSYPVVGQYDNVQNPLYNSQLNVLNQNVRTEIINNFSIEWDVIDALKFKAQLGISKAFETSDEFYPASHTKFDKLASNNNKKGSYRYETGESMNFDGNVTLTYSKVIEDKHQIYAGLDYSMAQREGFNYLFSAEGFASEKLVYLSNALQYEEGTKPAGGESISRRVGFTGNFNYTYDNKYFLDASYRMDGASQFGSKNKFAPFWSTGLGWNIHNESFLKDVDAITMLRLKGSYGQTGSLQFDAYQALSTLQYYPDKKYMMWNAAQLMGLGNENLKWQTTNQMNVGIEYGIYNNRIKGSFDYYNKKTTDLLSEMNIPLSQGFGTYIDNVGEITNNGYEASLSGYVIRDINRNIIWSVTGKIAYNDNKVTKLSDAIKAQNEEYLNQDTEINNLIYEGRSINSIYAVRSMGINPSTGDEVFLDKNNNITKTWRASDKVYLGVSEPKYRGNISSLFSYKDFSVNLSFGYHFGGNQYNTTLLNKVEVSKNQLKQNVDKRVLDDRWQQVGDVKFYKRVSNEPTKATSRFVMSDKVFEFQSASLSYRLSTASLVEKAKIQSITFGLNMSDIFYISSVKRERGIDYPFARRIGFNISLLF